MKAKFTLIFALFFALGFNASAQWERISSKDFFPKDSLRTLGNYQSFYSKGDHIMIGSFNTGVWRSEDAGNTWKQSNEGISANNSFSQISGIIEHKSDIYINHVTKGVLRSQDLGLTWDSTWAGLPNTGYPQNVHLVSTGTHLVLGYTDNKGVYVSSDDGATWSESNSGLENKSVASLFFKNGMLFAGTNEGVFVSTDNGASWASSSGSMDLESFKYSKVGSFASVGEDIFLATDKGANAFGTYGGIYRSADGGASWQTLNDGLPGTFTVIYSLRSIGTTLFVIAFKMNTSTGGIYMLKQGDTTWTSAMDNLEPVMMNLLANDRTYMYMLGGEVYRRKLSDFDITLGGGTLSDPLPVEPLSGTQLTDTTVTIRWNSVAGAVSYQLQVSTDSTFAGSMLFDDATLTDTAQFISGLAYNTQYFWRVRAIGTIAKKKDDAANVLSTPGEWSQVSSFSTPQQVNSVREDLVRKFSLEAFPNPVIDNIVLKFDLENNSPVKITLVNSRGELQRILCDEMKFSGAHSLNMSLREFPQGQYFLDFSIGNERFSLPVGIVK